MFDIIKKESDVFEKTPETLSHADAIEAAEELVENAHPLSVKEEQEDLEAEVQADVAELPVETPEANVRHFEITYMGEPYEIEVKRVAAAA